MDVIRVNAIVLIRIKATDAERDFGSNCGIRGEPSGLTVFRIHFGRKELVDGHSNVSGEPEPGSVW